MSEETYERNYIAIRPLGQGGIYRVFGYFANHKIAWMDDNEHTTRNEAQEHAEFLVKEFSMGGENNPIPIFQLDRDRMVMIRDGDKGWIKTFMKVTDRL